MCRSWKRSRISAAALLLYGAAITGCANLTMPRIDPTGEQIFLPQAPAATPLYREQPGSQLPSDDVAVTLSPHLTVAPVGSEVVLLAGVCGPDGYLRTNRRLEWSLASGGVGHFVAVGGMGPVDLLLGDFNLPRKIDNTFAVGITSRSYLRLNQGTATTDDDTCLQRGQGWITVSSPVEGTSHVTVCAPEVYTWDARTRSATIHWVDAEWRFPPPAINPAGTTHSLTTSVVRHTDQSPCVGWLVRYEILDGPPAGFSPNGAAAIEVATNAAGQAGVELFQKQSTPGTNQIAVQVIRPAGLGGPNGKRLVVGQGTTLKTWTAPALAVRKSGPSTASVGSTATYRIEVSNPGDLPAENVLVTDQLPDKLSYLDSQPAAQASGKTLRWQLGQLAAGQTSTIELNCRAAEPGSVTNCADAVAAGGLKASDCATTTVISATVEVKIAVPRQATVGDDATFTISITNRGQLPTGKLLIKDRFGEGLEHAAAVSPIERDLGTLAAGETQQIKVTFRVAKAGRLCHTVEIHGAHGVLASAEGCVTAVAPAAGAGAVPPAAEPSDLLPGAPPTAQPSIAVTKTGPAELAAGQTARFTIDITNTGAQALTDLKVDDAYDAALYPDKATEGNRFEDNHLVWAIERLEPGETTQLEVHCLCQRPAQRACNRVTVTNGAGAKATGEACLAIRAAAGKLNLEVADLHDPIGLGKELTYELRVSNDGAAPHKQVVVVATVPLGMMPVPIGTSGPKQIRYTIQGRTIRFDPLAEISPGERFSYRVRASAQRAGKMRFRAELTSQAQPQAVSAEEITEVFP